MSNRLVYLDTGRGGAALVVLWHHVMVFAGSRIESALDRQPVLLQGLRFISDLNFHAVMLFFFISGWSILLSVRKLTPTGGQTAWETYLWHRARRILPMFWISLLWAYVLTSFVPRPEAERSLVTLLGNLVFLQTPVAKATLVLPFAGNGPLWSLSFEVWYYLALPVLVLAVDAAVPRRLQRAELGLMLGAAIGVAAIGLNRLAPNPLLLFASLWPVWLAGYLFGLSSVDPNRQLQCLAAMFTVTAAYWGLAGYLRSDTLGALREGFIVASLVGALTVAGRVEPVRRFLALGPVRMAVDVLAHIGHGGYSIYILHYPLLILLAHQNFGPDAVLIAALALVILAPTLETSLQRQVNRLGRAHGRRRHAAANTEDSYE